MSAWIEQLRQMLTHADDWYTDSPGGGSGTPLADYLDLGPLLIDAIQAADALCQQLAAMPETDDWLTVLRLQHDWPAHNALRDALDRLREQTQ